MTDALHHARTADTLNRAHKLLRRDGWCQRVFTDASNRRCVTAALDDARANGLVGLVPVVHDALSLVIGDSLFARWNDTPGRTISEVLDALARAADEEMEKAIKCMEAENG